MTDVFYLSGTQLFSPSLLEAHRDVVITMVESDAWCRRLPFHQQKLGLVLAAMRSHRDALTAAGFRVRYHDLDVGLSLADALKLTAQEADASRLHYFTSEDHTLTRDLLAAAAGLGLKTVEQASPMFLLDAEVIDEYFGRQTQPRMANFYRDQRRRMNILLDGDQPTGGRWSFDADNRAKLPRRQPVPELPAVQHTPVVQSTLNQVHETFADHPGDARSLWLPADRAGAQRWLDRFLEERFIGFGTYEDALTVRSPTLFHSALSPLMNLGLITPAEVVQRALEAADAHQVPLNDLEGFIRQIIGWREFVRGVYRRHRGTLRDSNVWGGTRVPKDSWLRGDTGLLPLDLATRNAIDYGWNHHIERLMVIANLMNLAEIAPPAAYRFFMGYYIDAYDWVMVPNLYGMGLNSDGGIFTTKPYICGSNYIRKMSDYAKGEWTDVMDGLYWRFVARHRSTLERNPRLAVITRGIDRMDTARRKHLFSCAENFITDHTLEAA